MRIQWFPIDVAAIVGGFGSASLYPLFCRVWSLWFRDPQVIAYRQ